MNIIIKVLKSNIKSFLLFNHIVSSQNIETANLTAVLIPSMFLSWHRIKGRRSGGHN